ncbi:hypothetical protein C0989_010192, partial [Termitomyces sp. Mn162]
TEPDGKPKPKKLKVLPAFCSSFIPVMTRSPKPRTSSINPLNPQRDPQRSAELPPMPHAYFG